MTRAKRQQRENDLAIFTSGELKRLRRQFPFPTGEAIPDLARQLRKLARQITRYSRGQSINTIAH